MQANEEGGLTERAKRRAAELANDADVRTRAPKDGAKKGAGARERTRTERFTGGAHDPRVPVPGTVLTRKYKRKTLSVLVLDEGFEFGGSIYKSLSAIARKVTGTSWNGFTFFGLNKKQGKAGR